MAKKDKKKCGLADLNSFVNALSLCMYSKWVETQALHVHFSYISMVYTESESILSTLIVYLRHFKRKKKNVLFKESGLRL